VSRDEAEVNRESTALERLVMNGPEGRFVTGRPAAFAGPPAQVHVFIIKEIIGIKAAQLAPTGAS
jgi:hypothetical protein